MMTEEVTRETIDLLRELLGHVNATYPEFVAERERKRQQAQIEWEQRRHEHRLDDYRHFGSAPVRGEMRAVEEALDRVVELRETGRCELATERLDSICEPLIGALRDTKDQLGRLYCDLLKEVLKTGSWQDITLFRDFIATKVAKPGSVPLP